MNRRNFIKFMLLSISSMFMPLSLWASVFESKLNQFMDLSKQLTGFENLDIILGEQYLEIMQTNYGEKFDNLLSQSGKILTETDIGFLFEGHHQTISHAIIELWYTGALDDKMISAEAYQNSLLWPAIVANPPGTCEGEFGFWQSSGEQ